MLFFNIWTGGKMMRTIKQVTEVTGLSADTLRYYEKEGIITPIRHENRYRCYDEHDISALKNIVVMKYAHFTLAEMKKMEDIYLREPSMECNEIVKRILNKKIDELNQAIRNYRKIIILMETLLQMVDNTDVYHCNEERIDEFIEQIFCDIQNGG
jgi:DNA-binding transcriptional MerR regulator